MNPIFITGLALLLNELLNNDQSFSGIKRSDIIYDFSIKHNHNDNISNTKRTMTKTINKLIIGNEGFKIGKTGNPEKRSSQYQGYKKMYLLCYSKEENVINELEAYYNEKYFDNQKNDNKRKGSACKSISSKGWHFVYLATR